ncbi:MAG: hypothetical protein HN348_20250 [Proteobacteria bacterium]|nr:hypothetical protein [Pseudomonadota bacterium]
MSCLFLNSASLPVNVHTNTFAECNVGLACDGLCGNYSPDPTSNTYTNTNTWWQ